MDSHVIDQRYENTHDDAVVVDQLSLSTYGDDVYDYFARSCAIFTRSMLPDMLTLAMLVATSVFENFYYNYCISALS